ncbi:multidrug effflux MFS transporter [Paracoccus denitrificans]|jgi:DHA1 family bicyclomycin/chloramphenicol resistance-like MFS transporter|uniref:Bcr/CflA family efflux transporter n=1 Tax=Paracoccus denitrificans (strain Pd 1222) TaxID=318586 RepID=A1B9W1_PARDP|nr:multidrug effflux MFS transporter [Paracoccus denitrificans]ABL72305.1 drug resistance transporter, Bcr/CflA subfamily [Paracoccus denitrificans PD1222]MBB4629243.1 DHA1 family bicyclomycin/chloramphenicol resistance-like MFS transporter [Paracoccus denitrificans]MCU7430263.1 multidrug effflux MFS transporter [Paracoccus denitrificans]QAR28873.1 Bcr/CflA family efflux MFS transporter [Paracoccus denitrificans]UFS66711.1 multidrug effflux MFS transporter [Paracoccus denitrificans]
MRDPLFRMALLLGLLSAVGPFAIDMYLPALPQVASDLHTSEAGAALTLTSYFIVFGIAQMIYGPMSDAVGRKRPLVIGVAIFLVATVAASLAPTIGWLIAARAVQGLGAATLMAVPRAVIRDMATGPAAAKMMAAIMIVISVSPMLAPLTGSAVMAWGGWREIFAVLAAAALLSLALILFVLPETLPAERRRPVRLAAMAAGARRLLTDRRFLGLTMIGGFGMASFFVFLASASFVYTRQYGLSPTGFSLAFAVNAVGFFSASQFAGRLAERFGMERVISLAITGFAGLALVLSLVVLAGFDGLPVVIAGLFLANACLGLVMPTAMVMSLDPHPDIAGLASSLGGTIQMLTGGLMIAVTGPFLNNTAATMVPAIALCAALAWGAAAASLPRLRILA